MLVTNSLKNDLNHPNQYVVGLALCALGNISSTDSVCLCHHSKLSPSLLYLVAS